MSYIEELRWRGMLHDIMPGTDELLAKGKVSGYIGFDPTADSLHIGSLAQIMTLIHFQVAGHKPIALVGGATGIVGDPSGRSDERNMLSEDVLQHNLAGIRKQLEQFLNFDCGENSAEIVNNYDWFKQFSFLDFISDAGKYITVNYMLAKDSVKMRLESGMSFTEFCYQLIQGYDFYYLWKNKGVLLQMGGSDQWGNIVTGTELIRRKDGGEAFALTTQLIRKADGTKFGKSMGGNIWLDANKTSPYKFYQYWLNASDEDAKNFIKIFTLKTKEEIDTLIAEHEAEPHLRKLQKALADDITVRVHSKEDLQKAIDASNILFGQSTTEQLNALTEQDILDIFEGVPMFETSKEVIENSDIVSLLAEHTQIFPSKGEARKNIEANAVSINKEKVALATKIVSNQLLRGKFLIAQKGKKNYFLIKAV